MARRRRRTVALAVAVLAATAVSGCGVDEEAAEPGPPSTAPPPVGDGPDPAAAPSSPFTVGPVPDGFTLHSAGPGTQGQAWGDDTFGTDEPYVVLSPDGTADHPDVVLVSQTGYLGYQGGLSQASAGYGGEEQIEVDGHDARLTAGTDERWADLVVARGEEDDDTAIRVTGPTAGRDGLAAVLDHVDITRDHSRPPTVPDPPDGLEVVGSVDARAVSAAVNPYANDYVPGGPGPMTAHGIAWMRGADDLAVLTLPEGSADLDALAVGLTWRLRVHRGNASVERRDGAVVTEHLPDAGSGVHPERTVWVRGVGGDLVVAAARGPDAPPLDVLAALAASVAPTDEATWDSLTRQAGTRVSVYADPGRTELGRGVTLDGRGWLLQDQPPETADGWAVDPCLVLSGGGRACATDEAERDGLWVATSQGREGVAIVATTRPDVDALLVTGVDGSRVVPLVPVPGTEQRAAVVVRDGIDLDVCLDDAPDAGDARVRVELVDADAATVPCPP